MRLAVCDEILWKLLKGSGGFCFNLMCFFYPRLLLFISFYPFFQNLGELLQSLFLQSSKA